MKNLVVLTGVLLCFLLPAIGGGCKNTNPVETNPPQSESVKEKEDVVINQPEVQEPEESAPKNAKVEIKLNDVANHPAEKEITKLVQAGAVDIGPGGNFRPNEIITRGEFINWMYRYNSQGIKPHKPSTPSFKDVSEDHPLFETIEGIKAGGLIVGYPDGTLKLEKELTREELVLLLGWYLQHRGVIEPIEATLVVIAYEPDRDQVGDDFAYAVVAYKSEWREIFGNTPKLMPKQGVTRAEAAQWIITKFDKKFGS